MGESAHARQNQNNNKRVEDLWLTDERSLALALENVAVPFLISIFTNYSKIVNFGPFIIRKQLFVEGITIVSGFLDSETYTLCESRSQTCVKTCIIVQRVLESKCNTIEKETMLTLK